MSLGPRPTSLPSSVLIHPAFESQQVWAENGDCDLLVEGELRLYLTHCGQGRGLPSCQVSSWSIQPLGYNTQTLQTGQTGQTDRQDKHDRQDR